MPRLSSASASRLEAVTAALLTPVGAGDWSLTVLAALRDLLRAEHVALVLGIGDRLHFYGDERPSELLRHTHARKPGRPEPIFARGFWLHSGPHHAGAVPRPHDALGVADILAPDGSFVGACCTFGEPLPPTASRARLRRLQAVRPALVASARQQLARLNEPASFADMLEVVGDGAALVGHTGQLLHLSTELHRLLNVDPDRQLLREAIAALAMDAGITPPPAAGAPGRSAELRTTVAAYRLRCCPVPGVAGSSRRLMLVTVDPRRSDDLPTPEDLARQFGLTPRECDVTYLLQAGRSNAEVAESLGISAFTSRHHTERVLMKLGVRTRAAVNSALRALSHAVAGGEQLPVRALATRIKASIAAAGAERGSRAGRTRKATEEKPVWRYQPGAGDSAAPIAPRAD